MEKEIVYVIADNNYDAWAGPTGQTAGREYGDLIKNNVIYKGVLTYGGGIEGKKFRWNGDEPPFRTISKLEAFVLSRGKIEWLP